LDRPVWQHTIATLLSLRYYRYATIATTNISRSEEPIFAECLVFKYY